MKEYFVLSDIHSFYDEMITALANAGFSKTNENHIVIVCGDLLDRGPKSQEVVDFFYELLEKERAILVRGNHEDLFKNIIVKRSAGRHDVSNGTIKTLGQLNSPKLSEQEVLHNLDAAIVGYDKRWDYLISKMVNYYEIGNYIFVHGWIPFKEKYSEEYKFSYLLEPEIIYDPNWRDADEDEWSEARWINGMKCALEDKVIEPGKTIVCGHWHTSYGHAYKKNNRPNRGLEFADDADFSIFRDKGIIALDACTAYTGFCNCLHLTEEDIYEKKSGSKK